MVWIVGMADKEQQPGQRNEARNSDGMFIVYIYDRFTLMYKVLSVSFKGTVQYLFHFTFDDCQ